MLCYCWVLWLAQPYEPHMHLTPGLNDSAHLPNTNSSALTWDAIYPNNAVIWEQPSDFAGDSLYLAPSLTSFAVTEGRCCTASLMNPLHWTLHLRSGQSLNLHLTTYFLCSSSFYNQTDGVTMGSFLCPVIVNFYMESFEQQAISSGAKKCTHWYRYGYDTTVVWTHRKEELQGFLQQLNSVHTRSSLWKWNKTRHCLS
jgi:hypothetical protein